uniref:Uncharacterized protein n=1 Tax=Spongospora subterranea TaxID=70186 RepID=A0A0H5QX42_9EUKA|eukprot:CRZ06292.1 hypothetical protein [Spongospora subterranea]
MYTNDACIRHLQTHTHFFIEKTRPSAHGEPYNWVTRQERPRNFVVKVPPAQRLFQVHDPHVIDRFLVLAECWQSQSVSPYRYCIHYMFPIPPLAIAPRKYQPNRSANTANLVKIGRQFVASGLRAVPSLSAGLPMAVLIQLIRSWRLMILSGSSRMTSNPLYLMISNSLLIILLCAALFPAVSLFRSHIHLFSHADDIYSGSRNDSCYLQVDIDNAINVLDIANSKLRVDFQSFRDQHYVNLHHHHQQQQQQPKR